jgi:uncharacterized protein
MLLFDRLTLDAPRRTKEGFLVASAKAARAGVYDYLGSEVDPEGKRFRANDVVKVYRPADEVFDEKSVGSFLMKPITVDHPAEAVTADNWGRLAKGAVARALRDGEHLNFDLVLMDAAAIKSVEDGKRALSNGYACELEFVDGVAPDGTAYQAVQSNIRGNHVALVDAGRAGPECRIGDRRKIDDGSSVNSDPTDAKPGGVAKMPHTLMIDGFQITDVSDSAKAAIEKLQGQVKDAGEATAKLTADLATANTTIQTRDGEIVALKKQVEDAAITPAKLQALADARAKVIEQAKKLDPNVVTDGKTDAEIRRAAVNTKLGDAAKDMADAAVDGAFAALIAAAPAGTTDNLRSTLAAGHPNAVGDAKVDYDKAMEDRKKQLSDAWKPEPAKAA